MTNTNQSLSTTISPLVSIELHDINGKRVPAVTSLQVAEAFGKEHKHVVRDIRNLLESDDFTETNFGLSEYTDSTGRIASLPSKSQCPRAYFPFERENMTLGKGSRFNGVFKGVS